ncbi:hypothetical protein [Frankia sp. AiPs1]|uniref:hypothetical protein n=1 Tax=Frankia sp. AiPs1 TaxID=573493 RepID=UPI002042CAB2|nr:hypothetical protein [Frankia sp. AiPs1]
MRYVIASASAMILARVQEKLSDWSGVEFRVGRVPDTWSGCDAMVMWWPLAHDRFGGIPEPGVAKVLRNGRGDDLPGIILATPSGPGMTSGVGTSRAEIEDYSFRALESCFREYRRRFPESDEKSKILVHIEASGLDIPDLDSSIRGIARALQISPGEADKQVNHDD